MTTTPSTSMPIPENVLPRAPQRVQPVSAHSDAAPARNISVTPPMHNTMNVVHPFRCGDAAVTPRPSNTAKTSTAVMRVRGSRLSPSRRRNSVSSRGEGTDDRGQQQNLHDAMHDVQRDTCRESELHA